MDTKKEDNRIQFRLQDTDRELLDKRAADLGMPRNDLARDLMLGSLLKSSSALQRIEAIEDSINKLRLDIERLRHALGTAMGALMESASEMPQKEIKAWVDEVFYPEQAQTEKPQAAQPEEGTA